jgi:hypothetical protein
MSGQVGHRRRLPLRWVRQNIRTVRTWVSQAAALACGFFLSSNALAEESETVCEDSRVRIQGRPDDRWIEPIVRACEELQLLPDRDPTAHVRILASAHELIVEVALNDGRSTLRRVRSPEALQSTLEALLTVPPAAPSPPHTNTAVPLLLSAETLRRRSNDRPRSRPRSPGPHSESKSEDLLAVEFQDIKLTFRWQPQRLHRFAPTNGSSG